MKLQDITPTLNQSWQCLVVCRLLLRLLRFAIFFAYLYINSAEKEANYCRIYRQIDFFPGKTVTSSIGAVTV